MSYNLISDFSILIGTVENRKKRHDMQRKYTDAVIESIEHGAQTEWGHNGTSSESSIYSRA